MNGAVLGRSLIWVCAMLLHVIPPEIGLVSGNVIDEAIDASAARIAWSTDGPVFSFLIRYHNILSRLPRFPFCFRSLWWLGQQCQFGAGAKRYLLELVFLVGVRGPG